ncbi:MAG: type II toxin-antitoxin system antitoxin, RelB/DinJ family [Patescibacteria group bacterium]
MNVKTIINIKTDKSVKLGAKKAAEELGMPLGTIVNAFLRQLARDKEISFSVSASYKPTEYLERIIAEAEREWDAGKVPGPFTLNELKEHLR